MREKHPKTHVLHPCRKLSQTQCCQAVSRTGLETWSPASAWEVLAPIQQPIVTTSAPSKGRQGRSRLPFNLSGPLMSSVNSTCSTWFNPLISKVHQKRTSFRPRLRPMANAIKTGSAWQSHELKLKARWDDKVNLCVYSHSSTRSEMRASSTPKSDQRWGSDSHLESFNQSFKYSPVHNHLLCIICSGTPWLGTPTDAGTGRPQLQWQNGRLAVQACENLVWTLDPDMLKLWRGKSPPNANVWLPYICWLTGDAAFNQTEQIEGRYL